jgi:hypothetical protein
MNKKKDRNYLLLYWAGASGAGQAWGRSTPSTQVDAPKMEVPKMENSKNGNVDPPLVGPSPMEAPPEYRIPYQSKRLLAFVGKRPLENRGGAGGNKRRGAISSRQITKNSFFLLLKNF